MELKISPLAPKSYPKLPPIKGVAMATMAAGIKYQGREDLLLMVFPQNTVVAGTFTQSRCASAPVEWCKNILNASHDKTALGLVVNSGNANAFTGKTGHEATHLTAKAAAQTLNCKNEDIYLASTGVIGEPMDASDFDTHLKKLADNLNEDNWAKAADAIMTTDTYPKLATETVELDGASITINGIAKGSGMIAPDMATMLSFIVSDVAIDQSLLHSMFKKHVSKSFNSISVDSDTSTSDTALCFATGSSGITPIKDKADPRYNVFKVALKKLLKNLALQIVKDGEGARKLIKITVSGAENNAAAKRIAKNIANSPLVKTAVAGEDANWGRVVMAVGKSGEKVDRDQLSIWFNGIRVAYQGMRDPDYNEEEITKGMKKSKIIIKVELGIGNGKAKFWTCDLTETYIAINADYRS
jgi:glutamate N-acetyltransferase/amino-acid N-acetyltransferase